jgi:small-conductance mechanosensitive channel
LAYDSYSKSVGVLVDPKDDKKTNIDVSLGGPLGFWIGVLVIAALIQLVLVPFAAVYGNSSFNPYLTSFAIYAIYLPGVIVLPMITSLWIGDRVSSSFGKKTKSTIVSKGLINALYSVLVYAVTIVIIYIVMRFLDAGVLAAMSPYTFAEYMIGIPFAITIVIIPLFALLSAARRYG